MAFLPYVDADSLAPENRDLIKSGLNLHKLMVHSPDTSRISQKTGGFIRYDQGLNARLRELAILQVAYVAGSTYEWVQHLKIAKDFGVPDEDLAAVAQETAGQPNGLEPLAKLVMRAAREMTVGEHAPRSTMDELKAALSNADLVDLIFDIAFYVGFGRITGSFEIEIEPHMQTYLDRFPIKPAA